MNNQQLKEYKNNALKAYQKIIKEERIHSKDKRAIMGYILKPNNIQYKMSSGDLLAIKKSNDNVQFTFDRDNHELAMVITDIVDSMGYKIVKSGPGSMIISST